MAPAQTARITSLMVVPKAFFTVLMSSSMKERKAKRRWEVIGALNEREPAMQAAAMQAVALGGFLLVFLLSGLIYPISNIPAGLRWLSNLIWGRYYIEIVRDALLQGGGWPATWYKVLEIAATGGIFYARAWRTMRRMQVRA